MWSPSVQSFQTLLLTLVLGAVVACGDNPQVSHGGPDTPPLGGTGGTDGRGGGGNVPGVMLPGGGQTGEGGEGPDPNNPCDVEDPPPECFEISTDPACGDGEINQDDEECDDGNPLPGDGCSGRCEEEPYFQCTEPGVPCESTIVCGDGRLDPGEFCDDGNTEGGDGCSEDCLVQDREYVCPTPGEPCRLLFDCGDGRVNGSEQCDDSNKDSGDGCSDTCQIEDDYICSRPGELCELDEYCGDGVIQTSLGESCDDGDVLRDDDEVWGDGCSGICTLDPYWECETPGEPCVNTIVCGNGQREPGEACDDGNSVDGDGCDSCVQDASYVCPTPGEPCTQLYRCGDGRINGSDQCDDGNTRTNDGCSATCTVESGYLCRRPGQPCVLNVYCGDGIRQTGEACDDGNETPGDGCSYCTVDPFYQCSTQGQPCTSTIVCGDGRRDPGEACDDGNRTNGDGCNSTCTEVNPNFICPTPGSACIRLVQCGDGRVNGGETCDDGNTRANDGCAANCRLEAGFRCPTPGQACTRVTSCGDGVRQTGEACDDANTASGDGCSSTCRIEADWTCQENGAGRSTCRYAVVCGDGLISGTEVCDDGNTRANDGCSANCTAIETGWSCTREGFPCRSICGDGLTRGTEQCDDGGTTPGDGCDARCQLEENTVCSTNANQPSTCRDAVCGQNGREGTEPCDDGNNAWGDGCTPDCRLEPTCPVGAPCSSACGDGIKFPQEECDDGNTNSGDGCSSSCTIEDGYECTLGGGAGNTIVMPMIVRDFMAGPPEQPTTFDTGITVGSTDFQFGGAWINTDGLYRDPDTSNTDNWTNAPTLPGAGDAFSNGRNGNIRGRDQALSGLVYGFVTNTLSAAKKPVFAFSGWNGAPNTYTSNNRGNCPLTWGALFRNNQPFCVRQIQNATSFGRWFTDVDAYNNTYRRSLTLRQTGANTYVYDSETHRADGTAYPTGAGYKGFWPVDDVTGVTRYSQCSISGQGTPPTHNFHFTSETHHWFQFDASAPPTLIFTGDDDVFVYIGGRLALELGGIHAREQGTVALNAAGNAVFTRPGGQTTTMNLGLVNGGVYEIVVFQAERNTCESNYRLELQNFNLRRSVCTPVCGDGIVTPDEQCDDGDENTTTPVYGGCTAGSCTLGPYCGDAVRQQPQEACDNGSNISGWGAAGANVCAAGCTPPPRCGDGRVDSGYEECDEGASNTANGYNGCTTSCVRGPYCGDGVRNGSEACDDGVNNGSYGTCSPGCTAAPRCGDGVVQANWGEQCDGGANCDSSCRLLCGNNRVDPGEQCDDGVNAGGYGRCAPGCVRGPRCGDAVRNGPEQCDAGEANNTGGYNGCRSNCTLGPSCGDGVINGNETCDDGINDGLYGSCTMTCGLGPRCGDSVIQAEWGEECDDPNDPNCANCHPVGVCGDAIVQSPEECDDGMNRGGYGQCGPQCIWGPRCGDGVIQAPNEQCDEGAEGNDGGYGECGGLCRLGPYCGDGRVDAPQETCDDGVNDSRYESCTPECDFGPRCGDEVVQEEWGEECDDSTDPNCLNCRLGAQCGDRVVQEGEECDDGVNDGGYGECGPRCQYGPRCGDGVVQREEQCDDGQEQNTGAYGKCSRTCRYAAHCGDGRVDRPFEECDDGNNRNGDRCSAACKNENVVPR